MNPSKKVICDDCGKPTSAQYECGYCGAYITGNEPEYNPKLIKKALKSGVRKL